MRRSRRTSVLILLALALCFLARPSERGRAAGWGDLARYERLGGASLALAAHEGFGYAVQGASLRVVDLREGELRPLPGSTLPLPDLAEDLAVDHGRLYVPLRGADEAGEARLLSFDLSRPGAPRPIGTPFPLPAREVAAIVVSYPQAYLLTERGLLILDVKDRERPRLRRIVPLGTQRGAGPIRGDLAVRRGRVYVADPRGLLLVEADAPRPLAQPLHSRPAAALALADERLYAALGDGALQVFDTDTLPRLLAEQDTGLPGPQALAVSGGRAFVLGDAGRHLRGFRLTTSGSLRPLGPARRVARAASPQGDLLALDERAGLAMALSREGLLRVDGAGGGAPQRLPEPELPPVLQLHLEADRGLAAAGESGLFELDLRGPGAARVRAGIQAREHEGEIHLLPAPSSPASGEEGRLLRFQAALAMGRHTLALTERSGLLVLDLQSQPPVLVGRYAELPRLAEGRGALLRGTDLYLAAGDGSLRVLDLSRPDAPRGLAVLEGLGIRGLAEMGPLVLAAGHSGMGQGRLTVIDASDPARPRRLASVDLPLYQDRVQVSGSLAFLSGPGDRLSVVDLSDPRRPVERTERAIQGVSAGRIGLLDDLLLAAQPGRLDLLTALPSGLLRPLARVPLPWSGEDWRGRTDVVLGGGHLALVRGRSGLFLTEASVGAHEDPPPSVAAGPSRAPSLHLPYLSVSQPGARLAPPCRRPELVLLVVEDPAEGEPPHLSSSAAAFFRTLALPEVSLALGRFGYQGEMVAMSDAGPEAAGLVVDAARRVEARAAAPDEGAVAATRPDLALSMAEQLGTAADLASAVLVLVADRPPDAAAAASLPGLARRLRHAGWRIELLGAGGAGASAVAFGLGISVAPVREGDGAGEARRDELGALAARVSACR